MSNGAMAADVLARVCAEIEDRLAELRPAVVEYERLLAAAESLGEPTEARPQTDHGPAVKVRRARKVRRRAGRRQQVRMGPVELAIVAALEHGSHTLAELGVVTAMPAAELRDGLRSLLGAGRITRASREGRAAYALPE